MPTPRFAGAFFFGHETPKKFRAGSKYFSGLEWNRTLFQDLMVGLGSKFLILLHHLLFPVDTVRSSESYGAESHPVCKAARIPPRRHHE